MLQKLTRTEPHPPWSFTTAVATVLAMVAMVIIGTTISGVLLASTPQALVTGWSIGMIFTILFVMVTRRRTPQEDAALRIGQTDARLPLVMLFALGMAVTLDLLSTAVTGDFTLTTAELINFTRADVNLFGWLIALVFLVALQPVAEELVFRGMLFPAANAALGGWAGLGLTAAFHAVFHFAMYPPPAGDQTLLLWYGLTLPFLDALVFTAVRAYTGSTRASMVAHAIFGAFAVLKVFTFT